MQVQLDQLNQQAIELQAAVQKLITVEAILPGRAVEWANGTVASLINLSTKCGIYADQIKQISEARPDDFGLVSIQRFGSLVDQTAALISQVGKGVSLLEVFENATNSQFDETSGVLSSDTGNQAHISQIAANIQSSLDAALDTYTLIAVSISPKSIGTFVAAARVLNEKAREATKVVTEMSKEYASWQLETSRTASDLELISENSAEAGRLLLEVEKTRKTIEENEQKSAASVAQVEIVQGKAASLDTQVNEYAAQFDSFDKQLNARNKIIADANEELEKLISNLNEKSLESDVLLKKAGEMLGSATIAGLSATYKQQMKDIDKQLLYARVFYYISIVFLVISVCIGLNLFEKMIGIGLPAIPTFTENTPTGNIAVQIVAALGARGLLILPALLLAGFAAHRHSALFRLREEYGHKYTIAASVQGFKQQAPSFEEQIAAAVFTELLINPVGFMDKEASGRKTNNGFLDKLIRPRVEQALREAGQISV